MEKIFLAIKHFSDNRNKEFIETLSSLLEREGFQTICLTRDYEHWGKIKLTPKELIETAFEQISCCNSVLIETTISGTGLGIEAGYAYAKGIPIYTIAEENVEVSETLLGISSYVFNYKNYLDLVDFFKRLNLRHTK